MKESTLLKVMTIKNIWFTTSSFLIMGLNSKIKFLMAVMSWQCCVLILAMLLFSLSKGLIIVALSMTLANLKQLVFRKLYAWWLWVYIYIYTKMHFQRINIKNRVYSYFSDNFYQSKKKFWSFILLYVFTVSHKMLSL